MGVTVGLGDVEMLFDRLLEMLLDVVKGAEFVLGNEADGETVGRTDTEPLCTSDTDSLMYSDWLGVDVGTLLRERVVVAVAVALTDSVSERVGEAEAESVLVGTCEAVRDSGIVSVSVGDTVAGSDTVSDFLGVTVGDGLGVRTIVELGVNRPVAEALRLGVSSPLGDTLAARLTLRDTDVLTLSEPEEVASAVCDGECDWLTRGDFVVETRTLLEILTSLVAVHAPDPGSACSFGLQATHADCDVLPSLGLYVFAGQRVQPALPRAAANVPFLHVEQRADP